VKTRQFDILIQGKVHIALSSLGFLLIWPIHRFGQFII